MGKIKFGTGGFRAIIGEAFNKENVRLVAEALSLIIEEENAKKVFHNVFTIFFCR